MLTLVNINRMRPLIAPIGVDYVAGAVRAAGIEVDVLDLGPVADPRASIAAYFASHQPRLVGISLRNTDDCFWPSTQWFVPDLREMIAAIRRVTDAPIVLGGVGFSIFAECLVRETGVEFGVHGDGEPAMVQLARAVERCGPYDRVEGLIWRDGERLRVNPPAWTARIDRPAARDAVDHALYFRMGGQGGFETRRGCPRRCLYCADPAAKGPVSRLRDPALVVDEIESLLSQGVDVLHTCDAEFNVPRRHAVAVCEEMIRRGLGERVRWYAYLAVVPFDAKLAELMRRAGCVGINFTGDSASPAMLKTYRQPHGPQNLGAAVRLCRANGITVMIDLLFGGPGETPETAAETVAFMRRIDPDCVGAAVGVRLYPGTGLVERLRSRKRLETSPEVRRRYDGPVDLLRPTFFISAELGPRPAFVIRELIGRDARFFPPAEDGGAAGAGGDHNYNDNMLLSQAIANGARGAYWDILRRLR